ELPPPGRPDVDRSRAQGRAPLDSPVGRCGAPRVRPPAPTVAWKVRMSTPDTPPLSPLDADAVAHALSDALTALAAARDLDELKTARLAHTGERSPLALANRAIGGLAPADKA